MVEYKEITQRFEKFNVLRRGQLFSMLENEQLHIAQLPVLEFVMQHNGCTQAELAEFLCITPASVAVSTKRMQSAGFIEKREDKNNLRCKNLFITEAGKKAVHNCRKIFDEFDSRLYSGLSDNELSEFMRILDRLIDNINDGRIDVDEALRMHHRCRHRHHMKFKSEGGGKSYD